jgi:hypothetical protein
VRLCDGVVSPVTVFDDTFRRSIWARWSRVRAFQVSFDGAPTAFVAWHRQHVHAGPRVDRVSPLGVSVRTRSTRYTTPVRQGWLNSVSLGVEPFGRGSLQLSSGWRSEQGAAPTSLRWLSADMDVSVLRSLFVIVSAYQERGGMASHDLLFGGARVRF